MGDQTESSWEQGSLTQESLLDAIRTLGYSFKRPELPRAKPPGRFERMMNRLGWYRQTEVLVIDREKFMGELWPSFKPIPWIPKD